MSIPTANLKVVTLTTVLGLRCGFLLPQQPWSHARQGCNVVSELGIEKVVVELNGFRQRTAMLKEEISKVSRALGDRAAQLNEIVAKNLRDLREQLGGTALSGYLALQGKYTQGEIGEQEYNMQRDYYRNELQGMVRRLDEARKLMMIMAQLDSRSPGLPGTPRPTP